MKRLALLIVAALLLAGAALAAPSPAGRRYQYSGAYAHTMNPPAGQGQATSDSYRIVYEYLAVAAGDFFVFSSLAAEENEDAALAGFARMRAGEEEAANTGVALFPTNAMPRVDRPDLRRDATWTGEDLSWVWTAAEAKLTHRVTGEEGIDGRDCWVVESKPQPALPLTSGLAALTAFSQRRSIEKATGDVVRMAFNLTVETGEAEERGSIRFSAQLKLDAAETLEGKQLKPLLAEAQALLDVEDRLTDILGAAKPQQAAKAAQRAIKKYDNKYGKKGQYAAVADGLLDLHERLNSAGTPGAAGPPSPLIGKKAPEFELTTLDGAKATLADHRGKVVLLNFFASWCGPCHAEAPHLESEFQQGYNRDQVVVLAVNGGEQGDQPALAAGFRDEHKLTYPVLLDRDDAVLAKFAIEAFPTNIVIDQKGVVRYYQAGFDPQGVKAMIEKLLK